jgi:hypothetical protein
MIARCERSPFGTVPMESTVPELILTLQGERPLPVCARLKPALPGADHPVR